MMIYHRWPVITEIHRYIAKNDEFNLSPAEIGDILFIWNNLSLRVVGKAVNLL